MTQILILGLLLVAIIVGLGMVFARAVRSAMMLQPKSKKWNPDFVTSAMGIRACLEEQSGMAYSNTWYDHVEKTTERHVFAWKTYEDFSPEAKARNPFLVFVRQYQQATSMPHLADVFGMTRTFGPMGGSSLDNRGRLRLMKDKPELFKKYFGGNNE